MRRVVKIQAVYVIAIILALDSARAGTAEEIEARWRREYPRAAAELEEVARSFLAKGTFSSRAVSGETSITNELTVAAAGDKKVFICDRRTIESSKIARRPDASDVRCRTPGYAFRLRKESSADPFVLVAYSEKFDNEELDFYYDFDIFCRCATVYMQKSLLQRMRSPSFVLKSDGILQEGRREIVRVDYDIEEEHALQSGSVYLDPALHWAIRRVEVISDLKKRDLHYEFRSETEYEEVGNGRFFPKRTEFVGRTRRPDLYHHDRLELNQITVGAVPEEMFKLTAYGLPDIPLRPLPEPSTFSFRNPFWWGSLMVAVISFALLRVTRPRKAPTSSSNLP